MRCQCRRWSQIRSLALLQRARWAVVVLCPCLRALQGTTAGRGISPTPRLCSASWEARPSRAHLVSSARQIPATTATTPARLGQCARGSQWRQSCANVARTALRACATCAPRAHLATRLAPPPLPRAARPVALAAFPPTLAPPPPMPRASSALRACMELAQAWPALPAVAPAAHRLDTAAPQAPPAPASRCVAVGSTAQAAPRRPPRPAWCLRSALQRD
jgi:hypothetical protein